MPVMSCTKDGQSGYKWGESGTCYVGPDAKKRAKEQGRAIEASKSDSLTEYREDIGGDISTRLDDNGYLRIDGYAAKAGVLTYLLPDGTIRKEYVPAETLFNSDSLNSLIGAPVTVEHPGVLNSDNASQHSRGSVPKADADGEKLKVGVVITAKDAIESVKSGKRQLSPGYRAELDFTPGEYQGIKYDAVQTRRVYNHLAIVSSARGGPECRLHLDSLKADGVSCAVEVTTQPTTDEVTLMPTVKLTSGATVEVADASTANALQNDLNQLSKRADAADKMVDQTKYDELQGKYDALMAEMEKMKADMGKKMDSDEIGSYIQTVESARKLKSDVEIKADGQYLPATGIMAAALGIDAKDKSEEYIKGRFDHALELLGKDSIAKQRDVKLDSKDIPKTGREKFIEAQKSKQFAKGE